MPDQLLVARVAAGDRLAMQLLFERHREFVFRVALGICGDREEAVDIVQEVFLAVLERAATLKLDRARFSTWLYRVTHNRSIDRNRRAFRAGQASDHGVVRLAESGPEARLLELERRRLLDKAVARLPARPREVFVLRVGLGLSADEIASLIGIRSGAVRVALSKAKALLHEALAARSKVS